MHGGFGLGRIFGIKITVDWSWFFIFVLVTWNLAAGVFPQIHPDWGPARSWAVAIVAALLFFASVLVHELAHALAARAQGIPVRSITLFLFGGVANIQREPPSPRAEFVITIVGPVASFLLGVLCLFLGGIGAERLGLRGISENAFVGLDPLTTVLVWLGSINIMLAVFNLIPGFPLDGGRVLRSLFWAATGSLRQATRWASWVGQAVALIFIVAGVAQIFGAELPFFGSGLIGGFWLAFVGWFLNSAAIQSYQQVVLQDQLAGIPVARLARPEVPAVPPDATVAELIYGWLMHTGERAFPVVEGDRLVGMVCLEDVREVPREAWETTPVRAIMTPADQLATASPQEDLAKAFEELARRDVGQLPVVQGGRLVGMLRRRDIARWLEVQSWQAAA